MRDCSRVKELHYVTVLHEPRLHTAACSLDGYTACGEVDGELVVGVRCIRMPCKLLFQVINMLFVRSRVTMSGQ